MDGLKLEGSNNSGDDLRSPRSGPANTDPARTDPADIRAASEDHALDELLATVRVPVREGFQARVMASLPAAGWELAHRPVRSAAGWRWPVAALSALLAAAAVLVAWSSPAPGGSFSGALAALGDLFTTSALAGAGLLGASWQGIGLVTSEALGRIPGGLVAFTLLVVCLNLLLFTLVRRRSAAVSSGAGSSGGGDAAR